MDSSRLVPNRTAGFGKELLRCRFGVGEGGRGESVGSCDSVKQRRWSWFYAPARLPPDLGAIVCD